MIDWSDLIWIVFGWQSAGRLLCKYTLFSSRLSKLLLDFISIQNPFFQLRNFMLFTNLISYFFLLLLKCIMLTYLRLELSRIIYLWIWIFRFKAKLLNNIIFISKFENWLVFNLFWVLFISTKKQTCLCLFFYFIDT